MIQASVPPPAPSFPRLGEKTWAELWDGMTWRTALLLALVLLLPGGMLLLPLVVASARRASTREPLLSAASPTETPLPG